MDDRRTHTTALARGTAPAEIRRDRDGLLDHLAAIDVEGWDGPSATALLTYLRSHVVRPLAVDVGLRGACAAHAEATAWEAVWLQLLEPSLRSAHSPWGVLWQTARRAMLGEILADRWGVSARRAWELDAAERAGGVRRPLSLEPLLTNGWEPPAEGAIGLHDGPLATAVLLAAQALREAGWSSDMAVRITQETAEMDAPVGVGTTVVGWRPLANRLHLPPWQARRLVLVLRGSGDATGLLARLLTDGRSVVEDPEIRRALQATRRRRLRSPMPDGATATHPDAGARAAS